MTKAELVAYTNKQRERWNKNVDELFARAAKEMTDKLAARKANVNDVWLLDLRDNLQRLLEDADHLIARGCTYRDKLNVLEALD